MINQANTARLGNAAVWLTWLVAALLVTPEMRAPFAAIGLFLLVIDRCPEQWRLEARQPLGRSIAVLPLVLMLVWWLYHPVFDAGWLADDPRLLRSVSEHGWLAHWYQPSVWRSLSGSFFTPWLTTSFALDLSLFGLSTTGFYAHHLLSFALALLLLLILLSRWLSSISATLAILLVILSASTAGVIQQLMTRHYIEGLCFYLVAVLLLLHDPPGTRTRALAAAVFALLAMACKEVYVPLVAVLTLAPIGLGRNQRLRLMAPTWVALLLYLGWRMVMLGARNMFIGYGSFAEQPIAIGAWLWAAGVSSPWPAALITVVVLTVVVLRWPGPVALFWLAATIICASALPFASSPAPRYLWLPTIWGALTVAALHQQLARKPGGRLAALALAAFLLSWSACLVCASPFWRSRPALRAHKTAASFVLEGGNQTTLLMTEVGSAFHYHSLAWLRRHQLGLGDGPRVCRDLCVCRLDGIETALQQIGEELLPVPIPERPEHCGDPTAALAVAVDYLPDQARLQWRFAGAASGRYSIAGPSDVDYISGHFQEVPAVGEIPLTLHEPYLFVVRYQDEDGWYTDSPWLRLEPTDPSTAIELRWQRTATTDTR